MEDKQKQNKILDIILYPIKIYERLTDRMAFLIAGIIIVGIIDLFSPDFIYSYETLFTGKNNPDLIYNLVIGIIAVIGLGVIDVVFFSVPVFDLLKYLKKKEGQPHNASSIKVMKVYVMSHFLVVPVSIALYYLLFRSLDENSSQMMLSLSMIIYLIIVIWSSAIITRGLNVLFSSGMLLRRLTFSVVFAWSFLLGMVFDLQVLNWVSGLFR